MLDSHRQQQEAAALRRNQRARSHQKLEEQQLKDVALYSNAKAHRHQHMLESHL
eukprot:gene15106-21162_t